MPSTSAIQPTHERDLLLALLVLHHGLELRAALALHPTDIDRDTGEIRLRGGTVESVQLDHRGLSVFRRWLAVRARVGITDLAPLFCIAYDKRGRERGQPLTKEYAEWLIRKAARP